MIPARRLWYPALLLGCGLLALSSALAQTDRPAVAGAKPTKTEKADVAENTLLYVGLFNSQLVNVYDAFGNGQPIYQLVDAVDNITGGIAVGKNHEVYVPTGGVMVVAFDQGQLTPVERYRFPDQPFPTVPLGIAVDGEGTLYAPMSSEGVLVVYPKGDTQKATLTIPMPSGETPYAAAVDTENNLYIEYGGFTFPSTGYIEECAPGSSECVDLGIQLGNGGSNLVVDNQGNLIACDNLAGQIDVFPPGSTQPRVIGQGLVGGCFFALDRKQKNLFVSNQTQASNKVVIPMISVFDYASGTLINTITGGIPAGDLIFGVALSPAER
jgi:hypothetical protein